MAHVFVLVEARELWMDCFLNDLLKRRYSYPTIRGGEGWVQPNPREIKLFDISVPEACVPSLMSDLAPFARERSTQSSKKNKANMLAKTIQSMSGMKPIYPDEASPILWKDVPSFIPSFGKVFDLIDNPPFEIPKISDIPKVQGIISEIEDIPSNIPYISWFLNKIEKIPYIGKRLVTRKKEAWKDLVRSKVGEFDSKVDDLFDDIKKKIKIEKDSWLDKDVMETPYIGKDLSNLFMSIRPFKPVEEYKHSGETRHAWVNVIPIGIMDDTYETGETDMGMLPKTSKGAELV